VLQMCVQWYDDGTHAKYVTVVLQMCVQWYDDGTHAKYVTVVLHMCVFSDMMMAHMLSMLPRLFVSRGTE